MPAHSSVKESGSHNSLKSGIVPSGFSALILRLDVTQYSLFLRRDNIHTPREQLQPSTTAWQWILNPTPGGSWARCQPFTAMRFIPRGILCRRLQGWTLEWRGLLAIPELEGRSLNSHSSDPVSDCRRLLGSTPSTRWNKGSHCRTLAHEMTNHYGGCLYIYPVGPSAQWQIPQRSGANTRSDRSGSPGSVPAC